MTQIYGYIRVSTKEQNEDRQLIAMAEARVPQGALYIDKQSGKDFDRPQYQGLLKKTESGRSPIYQAHRPARAQLFRDHRAMARDYEGEAGGYRGARYAAFRHAARQGFVGHVHQ